MLSQHRFDFAEFDPKPADLDLVVHPPQEFDRAVRQTPREVAGSVQACAGLRRMGVGQEPFGRAIRLLPVAARDTRTAQIQLSRCADGHRLLPCVQDVGFEVVDGTADGYRAGERRMLVVAHDRGQGADGGLCRAIMVDDDAGRLPPHLLDQVPRQRFTAEQEKLSWPQGLPVGSGHEGLEMRRHDFQHVDGMLREIGGEQPTIRRGLVVDDMETTAGGQGGKNHRMSQIGAQGGDGGKLQGFPKIQLSQYGQGVVGEVTMGDGNTLGLTGRAGRVDNVSQVVRRTRQIEIAVRLVRNSLADVQDHAVEERPGLLGYTLRHEKPGAALRHLRREPHSRMRRIDRHIGCTGLQHPQHGDDHVGRPIETEADPVAGLQAAPPQPMRHLVRLPVQVVVGQPSLTGDEGGR